MYDKPDAVLLKDLHIGPLDEQVLFDSKCVSNMDIIDLSKIDEIKDLVICYAEQSNDNISENSGYATIDKVIADFDSRRDECTQVVPLERLDLQAQDIDALKEANAILENQQVVNISKLKTLLPPDVRFHEDPDTSITEPQDPELVKVNAIKQFKLQ